MVSILHILIVLAGISGFFLAYYIHHKKVTNTRLVCPVGANCEAVVHSEYSSFLGVSLEYWGMLYYASIVFSYIWIGLLPETVPSLVYLGIIALTVSGFIFSLYLTSIQAFVIRQWCTWCLTSAGLSTLIFFCTIAGSMEGIGSLITDNLMLLSSIHALSLALGVGAITVNVIFLFKFVSDYVVTIGEYETLKTVNNIVWVALGLFVITGVGLHILTPIIEYEGFFLLKMTTALLITITLWFTQFVIVPQFMQAITTDGEPPSSVRSQLHQRVFITGSVSLVAWYALFGANLFIQAVQSVTILSIVFLVLLAGSVTGGLALEQVVAHRK
ncbi:MAG: vitamin K epoxide reductase family protein [Candidatus Paceibacterota bacterium]